MKGEFPVGWGSFDESLEKPKGFKTIVVVDDYTDVDLMSHLITDGLIRIGLKPEGYDGHNRAVQALPIGNFRVLHAMHTMASDGLYSKAGIPKPAFEQLPAIYCIEHGAPLGSYVFKATLDDAVTFVLERVKPAPVE